MMLFIGAAAFNGLSQSASALGFGTAMGIMVLVCGIGTAIISTAINFGVGVAGGFIAGARK